MSDHVEFNFLTPMENSVLYHLIEAERIFNELNMQDQQDASDVYNFGHYVDAAKNVVMIRAVRRLDPEHLIKGYHTSDTTKSGEN